ncbi:MAG: class I SAM-dependent methyltransferase [Planctomycetes bacterium]|nr:class I SAM-dependent methyltransferase [Planctomycetota bacterium]
MEDPISITFHSFNRLAGETLKADVRPEADSDRDRVEAFLMRTGRPVPKVVVLGHNLALRCRQVDELGGAATGVDGGENVIELAKRRYPGGQFQRGDLRDLPVDTNAFDGVWSGTVMAHIPRAEVAKAMVSVHAVLRPGGLLYVRLPLGDEEGFEETELGPIYKVRWDPDQFTAAIGALDFQLLESKPFGEGELGMIFRREY